MRYVPESLRLVYLIAVSLGITLENASTEMNADGAAENLFAHRYPIFILIETPKARLNTIISSALSMSRHDFDEYTNQRSTNQSDGRELPTHGPGLLSRSVTHADVL